MFIFGNPFDCLSIVANFYIHIYIQISLIDYYSLISQVFTLFCCQAYSSAPKMAACSLHVAHITNCLFADHKLKVAQLCVLWLVSR